ncbi:MAG: PorP/SprF family type IX secretion system membrane protein, partial [Flavobacteriaceae bacterium]
MRVLLVFCSLFLFTALLWSQERRLPADFRQHNLTQFNAGLLNATYGSDWGSPNSFSIWTRWQWQRIDGDPTSIFANYAHQLNQVSAFGIGFLQHNTGTYLDTGANLNYVHTFLLGNSSKLIVGANLFGFQEKLADDRFISDPDVDLPQLEGTSEFMLLFSPGIRLQVHEFNLGLALENILDFSGTKDREVRDMGIVTGTLSNDFPVSIFSNDGNSFVRPIVYIRTIPNEDTQFGINGLLSTSKFWVQGGYNSFYGVSGAIGATFAKQFSIGGLLEFGTGNDLDGEDPTFELIASYHFGASDNRKKIVGFDVEEEDTRLFEQPKKEKELEVKKELEDQEQLELEALKKKKVQKEQERLKQEKVMKDSIAAVQLKESRLLEEQEHLKREEVMRDSIIAVQLKENRLLEEQKKRDSIADLLDQDVV